MALLLVVGYHARLPEFHRGDLGVDVFFVLSGFLITTLIVAERMATGSFSFRRFYARRFVRLFPAYFLVLLACLGAAAVGGYAGTFRGAALSFFYLANWGAARGQGLGLLLHTWSLSIEEQFYIVWPTAVLTLITLMRARIAALRLSISVLMIASYGGAVLLPTRGASLTWVTNATPTRAAMLLAGALLSVAILDLRGAQSAESARSARSAGSAQSARPTSSAQSARPTSSASSASSASWWTPTVDIVGCMGLAAVLAVSMTPVATTWNLVGVIWPIVALGTTASVAAGVLAPHGMLARILSVGPMIAIGKRSYGVYLWHYPVFFVLDSEFQRLAAGQILSGLVLSFALAALSYRFVEQPLIATFRQRRRPRRVAARTGRSTGATPLATSLTTPPS